MEHKQKRTLFKAAGFLMITMVISRILGYVRDIIVYNQFGQNRITDAYNASFTIPDFVYMLLVGGALSAAFIPIFSSYIANDKAEEGWKVASIVFNWIIVLLVVFLTVCFIFTPQLVNLIVPGFNPDAQLMTVNLTRIMFLQVIFLTFSGISMGILNSFKHFTSPAIGSVLYNLGIIVGGLLLASSIEAKWPGYGIAGFSVGVVIGAALYFLVQIPALKKVGLRYHFSFDLKNPGVQNLIMLIIPVLIGLSASEINVIISQNLASGLSDGLVSALRIAERIMKLPIGIFAISIAVAIFPTLTAYMAKNEEKEFKGAVSLGLRSVIFVTLPAAVALAVLSTPFIRFMFEWGGDFTSVETARTVGPLIFYCVGLVAYSAIHVLSRTFYAMQDTKTPVFCSVLSIGINICFCLLLVGPMAANGIALAYSIAGLFNMFLLLYLYKRRMQYIGGRKILSSVAKMGIASAAMAGALFLVSGVFEINADMSNKIIQIIEVLLSIGVGIAVYFLVTYRWKMEESVMVMDIMKKKFFKRKKVGGES
jgi:putative peptidoglycan lipid II flippase